MGGCEKCRLKPKELPIGAVATCSDCGTAWKRVSFTVSDPNNEEDWTIMTEKDNVRNLPARFADVAMYDAEPLPDNAKDAKGRPIPRVTLLNMTPDPLGAIAATCMMYEGKVVRSLSDVTDEQRLHYFAQVNRTHLKAPFEFVQFHFLIEGVTRSFTHQMVRQRTATYAQESLRFAVKDSIDEETALPPSLIGLNDDDPKVVTWRKAVNGVEDAYHALISAGVPAEDARGLLPHNITTRLHYTTDLRALLEHAGNRLCTQAQFEWRFEFNSLVQAIRMSGVHMAQELANLFRPICYMTGKCEFKASFDRHCSIRDRVEANANIGRPSDEWDTEYDVVQGNPIVVGVGPQSVVRDEQDKPVFIGAIQGHEWLLDPSAARVSQ